MLRGLGAFSACAAAHLAALYLSAVTAMPVAIALCPIVLAAVLVLRELAKDRRSPQIRLSDETESSMAMIPGQLAHFGAHWACDTFSTMYDRPFMHYAGDDEDDDADTLRAIESSASVSVPSSGTSSAPMPDFDRPSDLPSDPECVAAYNAMLRDARRLLFAVSVFDFSRNRDPLRQMLNFNSNDVRRRNLVWWRDECIARLEFRATNENKVRAVVTGLLHRRTIKDAMRVELPGVYRGLLRISNLKLKCTTPSTKLKGFLNGAEPAFPALPVQAGDNRPPPRMFRAEHAGFPYLVETQTHAFTPITVRSWVGQFCAKHNENLPAKQHVNADALHSVLCGWNLEEQVDPADELAVRAFAVRRNAHADLVYKLGCWADHEDHTVPGDFDRLSVRLLKVLG